MLKVTILEKNIQCNISLDGQPSNLKECRRRMTCVFIYCTYHLSSHGGLQFLLKGNQINIIQITNLQPSFYKSDQIKSNQMLVFGERGKPEYPGENLS